MKIAVLIQCHKNPEQINHLLNAMDHPDFTFFIHVDKKSSIENEIARGENNILLPDNLRVDVQWARISQVDATLNLLNYARSRGDFDFYWLCSGQDFPIQPAARMVEWFDAHRDNDFLELFPSRHSGAGRENNYDKRNALYFPEWMLGRELWQRLLKRAYTEATGGYNRTFRFARRKAVNDLDFYFGSSWICLTGRSLAWILEYLERHPEYYAYFRNCNCPDESFFQTLIMNSPYAQLRMDYLHYVDWPEGKSNPKVLTLEDYPRLAASEKLMARKFDEEVDRQILERLSMRVSL